MLVQNILARKSGLRCYGLTPPKRSQETSRIREIADRQSRRIEDLAPDGLVLYDLQDEAGRTGTDRPFPFLPTLEPLEYARDFLAGLSVPRILYKCVANQTRDSFGNWLTALTPGSACVLVGSPSSLGPRAEGNLSLQDAYAMLSALGSQGSGGICSGGVAIAERHARKGDEGSRLLAKHASGCRFFISQTVFDAAATKSLLADFAFRFAQAGIETPPFLLSFSPCGSVRTLEFMKWLGISFPPRLEEELRRSDDMLEKSILLARETFAEVMAFAVGLRLPIGINVESVSIRKEEIDASIELFGSLSALLARGG